MKRPTTLLILLLAGPSLASAQEFFQATSGGAVVTLTGTSYDFVAGGPDFSMSASISGGSPLSGGWTVGATSSLTLLATVPANMDISVDVHGAPLTFDKGLLQVTTLFTVPGPGIHSEPFGFEAVVGDFIPECFPTPCTTFLGSGTVALDVVSTGIPGVVNILDATYTIEPPAVPEPSTASLLLLGLAGFAVLSRRRTVTKFRTSAA